VETFGVWWGGITTFNQWFFIAAGFFTVFFLWQVGLDLPEFLGKVGGGSKPASDAPVAEPAPEPVRPKQKP